MREREVSPRRTGTKEFSPRRSEAGERSFAPRKSESSGFASRRSEGSGFGGSRRDDRFKPRSGDLSRNRPRSDHSRGDQSRGRDEIRGDSFKPKNFEELEVFKKAYAISLEIHKASLAFKSENGNNEIASSLRSLSKSICTILASSSAKQKYSSEAYRRIIDGAVGECDEMKVWLKYSLDLECINFKTWEHWRSLYQEIAKMLIGLANSSKDF